MKNNISPNAVKANLISSYIKDALNPEEKKEGKPEKVDLAGIAQKLFRNKKSETEEE